VLLGERAGGRAALDAGTERLRASYVAARGLGVGFVVSHARLALANGLAMRSESDAWAEAEGLARDILGTELLAKIALFALLRRASPARRTACLWLDGKAAHASLLIGRGPCPLLAPKATA
jgi:hypothetical protein